MSFTTSGTMHSTPDVGQPYPAEVVIPSDPAEARRVQEEIETALKGQQYPDRDVFSIKLAVEEALVNAIKHGNQMDRDKKVRVAYHVRSDRFDVLVIDEGSGFDPCEVPDPTSVENLERPCGRGLMLMRYYMNEVCYDGPGNRVRMTKYPNRNGKAACPKGNGQ